MNICFLHFFLTADSFKPYWYWCWVDLPLLYLISGAPLKQNVSGFKFYIIKMVISFFKICQDFRGFLFGQVFTFDFLSHPCKVPTAKQQTDRNGQSDGGPLHLQHPDIQAVFRCTVQKSL